MLLLFFMFFFLNFSFFLFVVSRNEPISLNFSSF